jgi:hypothetical protein
MFFRSMAVVALAAVASFAAIIPGLGNTGVVSYVFDNTGDTGAAFTNNGTGVVITNAPIFPGGWTTGPASWIWTSANSQADVGSPANPIFRTFRLTFDLTGLNPATAVINGTVAVDDGVQIFVNGTAFGSGEQPASFSVASNYTINSGNASFNGGLNTIDFRVRDIGNYAGLNNAISGTADVMGGNPVPEPSTLVLASSALVVAGLLRRRKQ